MDESLPPDELLGKEVVIEWFGGEWPSFHDAEIVSLALSRKGTSLLRIYPYFPKKPATVEFRLEHITNLELSDFSPQNVIFDLFLRRVTKQSESAIRIELDPCYGLSGWIEAKLVRVGLIPGKSPDLVSQW